MMLRGCFQAQTPGNHEAVKEVKEELRQESKKRRGNSALQDDVGGVQIDPAKDKFSVPARPDKSRKRRGTDVNDRAGLYPSEN